MSAVLDRKTAADLYLNVLVPWEETYRDLPRKGTFDIRSKPFTSYRRKHELEMTVYETKRDSDAAIQQDPRIGTESVDLLIFQKGDNSRARSLFKHLRNSIAHAHVQRKKIDSRWFLVFEARSSDDKKVFGGQLQQSRMSEFVAALKSTVRRRIT